MRFRTLAFACALLLGANIAAKGAPLEAYGELPTLDDIALSPDGSKLAYVGQNDKGRFVVVQSVSGELVDAMRIGEQKVRDLRWGDDTHVLITQSVTTHAVGIMGPRQEYFESELFDTATGRQVNLMARADGKAMNIVTGEPERRIVDGHPVIFVKGVYFPDQEGVFALYSIDVASGRTTRVATGTRNTQDDTVVPIEQSEDMARALKKAGKPVELVALDGEDHWLSRSATRLAMLSATVKFLDANNPP